MKRLKFEKGGLYQVTLVESDINGKMYIALSDGLRNRPNQPWSWKLDVLACGQVFEVILSDEEIASLERLS